MKKQFALLLALTSTLCGCASSIPGLLPGAETVTASEQKPAANCKQLMSISAQQSGAFLTAQNLERGAMNQIRNATLQQHGNYLYITANYSDTYKNSLHNNAMSSVTIKGIAYQCPGANPVAATATSANSSPAVESPAPVAKKAASVTKKPTVKSAPAKPVSSSSAPVVDLSDPD